MPNWKKLIVSGSAAELSTLKLTGLSGQGSETTSLMINGSNVIGTRDLGSNAFTSTTIPTNNNQLTNGAGYTTNTGTVTSVSVGTGLDVSNASSTPSITLDLSEFTDMTADVNGEEDELILLDNGAERRKLVNEIKLSQFNNDSGFTTNTGDITGVTAGDGLSGGGSSGGVTLAVDYAGTDNIILTATAYTDTIDTGDYILVSDSSNNVRYNTVSNLPFTNNSGDITQVNITAGDGLTGDVNTTSGAHTQTIDVDSTVVRTSGTQTVGGSKTFSSETTFTAGIQLNDSDVITLGTGNDYEILDDGTDTLFRGRRHEGKLYFQMENDGGTLQNAIILGSSGSAKDVGVELRYNNVARVWTTSGGTAIKTPSIVGISAQNDETTALMINGSDVVGTRELGSNAFTSTTIGTTSNALTVDNTTIQLNSGTTFNGSAARTISAKTAAISDGGTGLATADQIHTFVTSFGYTTNTGDITGVTAGTGLSGGGSSGGVTLALDLSELSEVTPASGDAFATLDSDGSTEQLTTVDALATLLAGSGLTASEGVLSISETGDISAVTAGVGLSGGGSSGAVTLTLDLSELSDVTPANGDKLATLDSDGSTEQLTTVAALATLFAGSGLTATDSVIAVDTLNQDTTGNAATATALATARTISGESFDGTANITLDNANITNGAGYTTNVGDITGITTAANSGLAGGATSGTPSLSLDIDNLTAGHPDPGEDDMVFVDFSADNASKVTGIDNFLSASIDGTTLQQDTSGKFIKAKTAAIANGGSGLATADQIHTFVTTQTDAMAASTTGNAATATALATARTIAGVEFDGTGNISLDNANITNGANYVTAAVTLTTAAQTNITSLGTLTTLTVDDITLNDSTISDASDLTVDCGGDITLDSSGNDVIFAVDGSNHFAISNSSGDVLLTATQQDKDLIFKGYDGGTDPGDLITALTLDMSEAGKATFNNDVVAFSDEKLKENIETLDGSKVYEMRGVSFTRKDTKKEGSGVIAQELQKIAPELVNETDGTLGVSYGNITGYLIEAIKDLKTEIEELKQKIK